MNIFSDYKPVILREPAVTAHADWYSYYLDMANIEDAVFEAVVSTDGNIDGSNYTVLELWETDNATPGTHTNSTQVAYGDLSIEIVDASNATTAVSASSAEVTIDSTSEDSVIVRFYYKGAKRYIHVMGDVTTAGSYPTGIIGVTAYVKPRKMPSSGFTPTTGAVS